MYIFTRLSTNERRSGAPGLRPREAPVNLAPLWPEAAAPRRHRPRRDRKLRVEEALLLQLGVDGRRRVRRKLEPRKGGCYAQQQRREEFHGSAGRWRPAREELSHASERGGWGGPLEGPTTSVASAAPSARRQQLFLPLPFLSPGSAAERQQRLRCSGAQLNELLKASHMFYDAGAVRFRSCNFMLRAPAKSKR